MSALPTQPTGTATTTRKKHRLDCCERFLTPAEQTVAAETDTDDEAQSVIRILT